MDSLLESKSFDDTDMSSIEYDPPSGSESDFKIIPESVFYDIDKLRAFCKKLYLDGAREKKLRIRIQEDLKAVKADLLKLQRTSPRRGPVRLPRAVRQAVTAGAPPQVKSKIPNQMYLDNDGRLVSAHTRIQQLTRDLNISEDDRKNLRKELSEAKATISEMAEKIKALEHELAILRKKLFGKSNERGKGKEIAKRAKKHVRQGSTTKPKKKPTRRDYSHLPVLEENKTTLDPCDRTCKGCGKVYKPTDQYETTDQIELKIEAYRKRLSRQKYIKSCRCKDSPPFLRAPLDPRSAGPSKIGDSLLQHLLLQKFSHQIPCGRILANLRAFGLDLSPTTINDAYKRLHEKVKTLKHHLLERSRKAKSWHIDETTWRVMEGAEGSYQLRRWYLWTFLSDEVVYYVIVNSRGSDVIDHHFAGVLSGSISADRFVVYRSLEQHQRFKIGYCWAHVRRDFIRVMEADSKKEKWASKWLRFIAILYRTNNRRKGVAEDSSTHGHLTKRLHKITANMLKIAKQQKAYKSNSEAQYKTLKRFLKHYDGLTAFITNPDLAIDNNPAERAIRPMVMGRKTYYGSGSVWAADFAGIMFSMFQTLKIWKINEKKWLEMLFETLKHDKQDELAKLMPWNLDAEVLSRLRLN
jgi:transposase